MPESTSPPLRDLLGALANSRRLLNAVQAVPCPRHHPAGGEPCWTVTPDSRRERRHIAVCDRRWAIKIRKYWPVPVASTTSSRSGR